MTLSKGQKLQITDCFVRASFENATQKGVPWLKLMLQDPSNPDGDSVEAKCFEPEVISTRTSRRINLRRTQRKESFF
jgi:hypothetical protein